MMKPKIRHLILDLLLAADGAPLSVRDAINAARIFGITANNVRVALVRLAADDLIESAGRGLYRLSPAAHELADDVATWRRAEQRVRDWSGGYLSVHIGPLGRSDRVALRRRQRALDMLGFRQFESGLYLRPDNIEDSVDAVRQRLYSLGLERSAALFVADQFDAAQARRIRTLWDGAALNRSYIRLREQMEHWLQRADRLAPDVAARECFLLGGKAIRQVVFDPLLPEPMVDVSARHAFIDAVHHFDAAGRHIWQQLWSWCDAGHDVIAEASA